MKVWHPVLVSVVWATSTLFAWSQGPVLGNIETPYAPLQSQVQIANKLWGVGSVAYGPVGTPLVITGSNLGGAGEVQFIPYKNGAVDPNVLPSLATVTMWSSNMLILTVPAGAYSGLVEVTAEGRTSNGVPFLVTSQTPYSASCPAGPTSTQLQITTASLHDGAVGQAYDVTLGATGGTENYSWSYTNGSLPSGLTLGTNGEITGTPTSAIGPVNVTFQVTDSSSPHQSDQAVLSITIQPQALNSDSTLYQYTAQYDPVGNIIASTDTVNGNWSMTALGGVSGYDSLNRLMDASVTWPDGTQEYVCWNYDGFGNRLQQELSTAAFQSGSGGPNACSAQSTAWVDTDLATYYPNNNSMASTNAHGISVTPQYDQSGSSVQYGDLTWDGINQYLYDADGRVCAVDSSPLPGVTSMTGYIYDGDGNRVAKGSITTMSCDPTTNGFQFTENYVLGTGGEELTMLDGSNNWQRTNVFVGGNLIATYDMVNNPAYLPGNGQQAQIPWLHFHLKDPLGTRRMQLSGSLNNLGQPETDFQNMPFGDQLATSPDQYADQTFEQSSLGSTPLFFTGKERDPESGNDYFGARYYASTMGRFLSPDPVKITPGRMANPQQLNLYSYVANNPLRFIDPDGETLQISGDVNEAQKQLCQLIGGDCNRISYNSDTHTITVDLNGIDLSQNEGAFLLSDVVESQSVYSLDLGSTMMTAGGLRSITNDDPVNLDNRPDWRFGKGKDPKNLPPPGVDDAIGIDPNSRPVRDSKRNIVPLSSQIFHELAEAYAKIDMGAPYMDRNNLHPGAHNDAVQRENRLRSQRPNMKLEGRAGDQLIRDPKPEK